jgi:osmotically-inducible protein OsmY
MTRLNNQSQTIAPNDKDLGTNAKHITPSQEFSMKKNHLKLTAAISIVLFTAFTTAGCSMLQHPNQSAGSYIDDVTISNSIRARFIGNNLVSAYAIKVETLRGVVQLSGFANNQTERTAAERIARDVNGVIDVRNDIIVKP